MEYQHLGKHSLRVSLKSWLTYGGATAEDTARSCIDSDRITVSD